MVSKLQRRSPLEEAIERKIAERVRHAELVAASSGKNAVEAGQQARIEGERLVEEKRFMALGIDPLDMLDPGPSEYSCSSSFTILYTPVVTLSSLSKIGPFKGTPEEVANQLMALIIDEVCAVSKLKDQPGGE